jgi:hypothetical protein
MGAIIGSFRRGGTNEDSRKVAIFAARRSARYLEGQVEPGRVTLPGVRLPQDASRPALPSSVKCSGCSARLHRAGRDWEDHAAGLPQPRARQHGVATAVEAGAICPKHGMANEQAQRQRRGNSSNRFDRWPMSTPREVMELRAQASGRRTASVA